MKHTLISIILIMFAAGPCAAQWNKISGDWTANVTTFGVQDSFLFIATTAPSTNAITRYSVGGGFHEADTGIGWGFGNITSFSTLGRYFYANEGQGVTQGTYRSTDNGSQWEESPSGDGIGSNGYYLFGKYQLGFIGPYLAISRDSGQTWDSVENIIVNTFATNGTYIYANTGRAIWRSTDTGNHWSQISPPFIGTMMTMSSLLFITNSGEVVESSDSGAKWDTIHIDSAGTVPESVNCLVTDGKNLFAGTPSGVFVSLDSGKTWFPSGNSGIPSGYYNVLSMCVFDTLLAINVTGSGFYLIYTRSIHEITDTIPASVVATAPISDSIEVYPNPATGMVTIRSGTPLLRISALNVMGTDVLDLSNQYGTEITFDLSNCTSGTYFLQIQTVNGTFLKKITIER